MKNLYTLVYTKNGKEGTYQIPAESELDACVRLGQIYGDDKPHREDVEIKIISIKKGGK
ncbi:MAG: hypothetical protein RRZ64_09110 [Rikenellaceae bacterium]